MTQPQPPRIDLIATLTPTALTQTTPNRCLSQRKDWINPTSTPGDWVSIKKDLKKTSCRKKNLVPGVLHCFRIRYSLLIPNGTPCLSKGTPCSLIKISVHVGTSFSAWSNLVTVTTKDQKEFLSNVPKRCQEYIEELGPNPWVNPMSSMGSHFAMQYGVQVQVTESPRRGFRVPGRGVRVPGIPYSGTMNKQNYVIL